MLALLVLHVLAAATWVGGSAALVFVAVPAAVALPGPQRAASLRRIATRWRPIGYGALFVLGLTGFLLGAYHHAWGDGLLRAKIVLGILLVGVSVAHDFVLGPRYATRRDTEAGGRLRAWLVGVGWLGFGLTVLLPVLGVILTSPLG